MAAEFNFDDAYASDSCEEDTWEGICRHVGLGYGNTDDEDPEYGNIGSIADGQELSDEAVILHKALKEFQKIIKLQRKHLEKWTNDADKSLVDEMKSSYKQYVEYSGNIQKKFQKLLGIKDNVKTEVLRPIYQSHKKTMGKFKCPKCEFEAMSGGKIYSHMADKHNLELVGCNLCGFKTANLTSLHNHKRLYCKNRKEKAKK